jgi:hypothetical protein
VKKIVVLFIILLLAGVLLGLMVYLNILVLPGPSNSECVIKSAPCEAGCYRRNQEPEKRNTKINCIYRPWFKKEKCELVNGTCKKTSCEDLGLDLKECGGI